MDAGSFVFILILTSGLSIYAHFELKSKDDQSDPQSFARYDKRSNLKTLRLMPVFFIVSQLVGLLFKAIR